MTPTEAPLRRALSTMAEQVEVVDLAGRVDAQLRHRRRRAQGAALLAAACVASVVTGVLLQTRDDEQALPTRPGPQLVHLDQARLGHPEVGAPGGLGLRRGRLGAGPRRALGPAVVVRGDGPVPDPVGRRAHRRCGASGGVGPGRRPARVGRRAGAHRHGRGSPGGPGVLGGAGARWWAGRRVRRRRAGTGHDPGAPAGPRRPDPGTARGAAGRAHRPGLRSIPAGRPRWSSSAGRRAAPPVLPGSGSVSWTRRRARAVPCRPPTARWPTAGPSRRATPRPS